MTESNFYKITGWTPTVYYAESTVECGIDDAWNVLLDYQAWNPTFVDSSVRPVSGESNTEGEIVAITKPHARVNGEPIPEFFAKTIKLVKNSHICWIVYKSDGETFRNFVDFGLTEIPSGVRFNVYYYAQAQASDESLTEERKSSQDTFELTAAAFKKYCEDKHPGFKPA